MRTSRVCEGMFAIGSTSSVPECQRVRSFAFVMVFPGGTILVAFIAFVASLWTGCNFAPALLPRRAGACHWADTSSPCNFPRGCGWSPMAIFCNPVLPKLATLGTIGWASSLSYDV